MHTTWAGKKVVDMMWNGLADSSVRIVSLIVAIVLTSSQVQGCLHPSGLPAEEHCLPFLASSRQR